MKSVLISIKPQWCELIASGEKTVEVRKTKPKLETPFKVYIYQTLHRVHNGRTYSDGKVIGEFVCGQIDEIGYSPEMHGKYISDIDDIHYVSCLNFEQMFDYLADGYGYAWHITDLVIYDKPKELREFRKPTMPTGLRYEDDTIKKPFQSWGYVEGSANDGTLPKTDYSGT